MDGAQWHYDFFSNPSEAIEYVNRFKPTKDGLVGLLEDGKTFQIWLRDDNSNIKWELNYYKWNVDNLGKITKLIKEGIIIPIGFNKTKPKDMWCFELGDL